MNATSESTINFLNNVQAVLYEAELKGQISDGYWEPPYNHYIPMVQCSATCDPMKRPGLYNMWTKRSYNFCSADLLKIVAARMILCAKIAIAFPEAAKRYENHRS